MRGPRLPNHGGGGDYLRHCLCNWYFVCNMMQISPSPQHILVRVAANTVDDIPKVKKSSQLGEKLTMNLKQN